MNEGLVVVGDIAEFQANQLEMTTTGERGCQERNGFAVLKNNHHSLYFSPMKSETA